MALEIQIRELIVIEKKQGKSLVAISREQNLSYRTVKRIWRSYKQEGIEGIKPKYYNCGPKKPKYYKMYRISIFLKKKYSKYADWGAPFIQTILSQRYPDEPVPSVRIIQKWFANHGLNKPRTARPVITKEEHEVKAVHDCWQIDAKENIILEDEGKANYLTTVDVKSGIALEAPIFSQRKN